MLLIARDNSVINKRLMNMKINFELDNFFCCNNVFHIKMHHTNTNKVTNTGYWVVILMNERIQFIHQS